jgi:outer membrane protein, heavy metal efflux system
MFCSPRLVLLALCAPFIALAGCAMQSYRAVPLDAASSAQRFDTRSLDTPELRDYMSPYRPRDAQWPAERWGLTELTLAALYDHPELEVARAQARSLRAEAELATQRSATTVAPRVEHHSLRTPEQSSPWSLGFEIQIPIAAASTGEAIRGHYQALAQAADLHVGMVAWSLRARVRARLLDLYETAAQVDLLERETRERETMSRLLEQRLEAGAASAVETNAARLASVDAQSRLRAARATTAARLGAMAEVLSMPVSQIRKLQFDYTELRRIAPAANDASLRSAALLNRLDVRSKLNEYEAAEADVRLEIARQYPSFAIGPGFLWDQGDSVWSIAASIVPAVMGNARGIAAAEARRMLAASNFRELQERVIAQAQSAEDAYAGFAQALTEAEKANALHAARAQQVERQFDAGYADRVELTAAHLQAIEAQRGTLGLRIEALRAQGVLEDALQVPLTGGPLPLLAGNVPQAISGLARQ